MITRDNVRADHLVRGTGQRDTDEDSELVRACPSLSRGLGQGGPSKLSGPKRSGRDNVTGERALKRTRLEYRPKPGCAGTIACVMSEPSDESNRAKPSLVRAEAGRFTRGTAPGPGRPKRGVPLSEQYRRETDWQAMRLVLETIALSTKAKDVDRIAAVRELTDRAWGRPLTSHELTVHQGDEGPRSFAHVSEERLRQMLAELDGETAQLTEGTEP